MEATMHKYLLALAVLAAVTIPFGHSVVVAQTPAPPPGASPFNPSFGDLMNTLVQPRHAKLGLIGREQNWVLAAYELHQLKDALTNISRWKPRFRNMSVPELMETMTGESVKSLDQAIQSKDQRQFHEAFDRLTAGCNACHAALNHTYIVIQPPDRSAFANQVFRAQ
jgi:hypothetical protein